MGEQLPFETHSDRDSTLLDRLVKEAKVLKTLYYIFPTV